MVEEKFSYLGHVAAYHFHSLISDLVLTQYQGSNVAKRFYGLNICICDVAFGQVHLLCLRIYYDIFEYDLLGSVTSVIKGKLILQLFELFLVFRTYIILWAICFDVWDWCFVLWFLLNFAGLTVSFAWVINFPSLNIWVVSKPLSQ